MGYYVRSIQWLTAWSKRVRFPPQSELEAAIQVLSHSPVTGYPSSTAVEVRLIAAYCAFCETMGGFEPVWPTVVHGEPLAWPAAIHEAAELQSLAEAENNPFDTLALLTSLERAHLDATVAELRFLREWSRQAGMEVPELALEMEHPVRTFYPATHARAIAAIREREDWPLPTVQERQDAEDAWGRIQEEEPNES